MTTRAGETSHGLMLFETAIGFCGLVWTEAGIAGLHMHEPHAAAARARLLRRFPHAREVTPPPEIQHAVDDVIALLRGEPRDLSGIALDLRGVPSFHCRVYEVTRAIPPGSTLTYGDIATRLGEPGAARAVGQALGRNPFPIIVPCHRVLAAGGRFGGFTANGGVQTKLRLLAIEGAPEIGLRGLFDDLRGDD